MNRSRLVLGITIGAAMWFSTSLAFRVAGGGSKKADCYSEFEVAKGTPKGKVTVECVDGTDCDADGAADCKCTFDVALCLNQTDPNLTQCTPHPPLTAAPTPTLTGVMGTVCGTTLPSAPSDLSGATCGTTTGVTVDNKSKPGKKPKKGACKMTLTATVGATPATDKDKLVLKCLPNPSLTSCGTITTTTTIPQQVSCTGANANPAGGPNEIDLVVATSGTDLDSGHTGTSHNFPVVGNSTLKACLRTCGPDGTPPCDTTASVGAGTPNGATFGAPLPLLAANVPVCVVNQWNGSPNGIGTINPLTGDASFQINLTSKVHLTTATQVCPRCNNSKCDSGPNQGNACTVDDVLVVAQSLGPNKSYNLSRDCPPDPATLAAPLDIRLPATTGTATLAGPKPCGASQDDNCNPHGTCGTGNCTGSACVSMGTDPSTGNPICIDSKGGLSQNCCNSDTTKSCFPTAGGGSIVRTGKPVIPSPPFPDSTYPKTGNGVVVAIFCIPATGVNSIDTTAGLPGPGALVTPGSQTWIK